VAWRLPKPAEVLLCVFSQDISAESAAVDPRFSQIVSAAFMEHLSPAESGFSNFHAIWRSTGPKPDSPANDRHVE